MPVRSWHCLGGGKRAAIVENALDNISTAARDLYRDEVYDPVSELGSLGIAGTPLDLRELFRQRRTRCAPGSASSTWSGSSAATPSSCAAP